MNLLIRVRWFWEIDGHTLKGSKCDGCNVRSLHNINIQHITIQSTLPLQAGLKFTDISQNAS